MFDMWTFFGVYFSNTYIYYYLNDYSDMLETGLTVEGWYRWVGCIIVIMFYCKIIVYL